MNYNCPHCGKFMPHTFCTKCGKPTETLLKYRVMFSIGLLAIPAVTIWFITEAQKLLPELEPMYAELFPVLVWPTGFISAMSVGVIVFQWIEIETKFRDYYKKQKRLKTGIVKQ